MGYAQDAELPFPVTYFDFTTLGGHRPKVCPVRAFRPRPRLGDGEALEDVIHLRLTSEEGLSGPSQLMLIGPSLGRPGWVDLYCDMTGCEARSTTRPPPSPYGPRR